MAHVMVEAYLQQKKDGWLKLRSKKGPEAQSILAQAQRKFDPENWLPKAAKDAGAIRFTTHPVTFSHPSAKKAGDDEVTAVISHASFAPDGYWRYGNAKVHEDALVNAASLPIYGFLQLKAQDGKTVIEHIASDTDFARELLAIDSTPYETLRDGFLQALRQDDGVAISSSKISQVYFPVGDDYHLLSIVTPSNLVFATRYRLESAMFGKKAQEARDAKKLGLHSNLQFCEFFNLTVAVHGGDNPQNISAANLRANGKTLLLQSMPPALHEGYLKFPSDDFFQESLPWKTFNPLFKQFHQHLMHEQKLQRSIFTTLRDDYIYRILDEVIEVVWSFRSAPYSFTEKSNLPPWQQRLLSSERVRHQSDVDWLASVVKGCSEWFCLTYQEHTQNRVQWGPAEEQAIERIIRSYVARNQELFL